MAVEVISDIKSRRTRLTATMGSAIGEWANPAGGRSASSLTPRSSGSGTACDASSPPPPSASAGPRGAWRPTQGTFKTAVLPAYSDLLSDHFAS